MDFSTKIEIHNDRFGFWVPTHHYAKLLGISKQILVTMTANKKLPIETDCETGEIHRYFVVTEKPEFTTSDARILRIEKMMDSENPSKYEICVSEKMRRKGFWVDGETYSKLVGLSKSRLNALAAEDGLKTKTEIIKGSPNNPSRFFVPTEEAYSREDALNLRNELNDVYFEQKVKVVDNLPKWAEIQKVASLLSAHPGLIKVFTELAKFSSKDVSELKELKDKIDKLFN